MHVTQMYFPEYLVSSGVQAMRRRFMKGSKGTIWDGCSRLSFFSKFKHAFRVQQYK